MAMTLMVIVGGAAIPLAHASVDRTRAAGAASYVAGRMAMARFEAVRRSAYVAIQFLEQPDGYWLQTYVDGNRNGVLTRDIARWHRSADHRPRTARLSLHGSGVRYSAHVTGIDPGPFNASDPVQIGSTTLLSFSPTGSSTSGTLFIRGLRGNQFAVRVLGATGRTRVLEFNFGSAHMAGTVSRERRASTRVLALTMEGMERARLRPGRTAHIINLSSWRRSHRNGLAAAAWYARRNAGRRSGPVVSRRRPHRPVSCRAARSARASGIAAR